MDTVSYMQERERANREEKKRSTASSRVCIEGKSNNKEGK